MIESLSIGISAIALLVSVVTAWLTLFRRGSVRMTRPTVVYFGPDGGPASSRKNKVFFRALLYATSTRGRIIENMFVRLRRDEICQNINIWVYGDDPLARGSGLFVGEEGVGCNHHFLLPEDATDFLFCAGNYQLSVFAQLVGDNAPLCLFSIDLDVSEQAAAELKTRLKGLYFDWESDLQRFHPHITSGRDDTFAELIIDTLSRSAPKAPDDLPTRLNA